MKIPPPPPHYLMDPMKQSGLKALMFPWLAHGHIFPFLELAKKLSNTKNFHIHFCSTAVNLDSVRKHLDDNEAWSGIELVELRLPSLPDLPPNYHTTKNIPPRLMPTLMRAFHTSTPHFTDIIAGLKPDLLIYDGFQPWSAKIAASLDIPSVLFVTSGSTAMSFFHHHYTHKSFDTFPHPEIFLREHEKRDLESVKVDVGVDEGFISGIFNLSRDIVLIKSYRGMEGKYMDYLSELCGRKVVPTGPLITAIPSDSTGILSSWMDRKSRASTLYVSFGSENYLSGQQMRELAKGLELTRVNFIWVVRSDDGDATYSPVEEILDKEFVDSAEMSGRGMFLRGWAPQSEILAHPSVGGFMSHCGWSSVTEGVYFGVPIVGVPLKVDQPVNCRAAVEAGVGVEVMRGAGGEFDGGEIAKAVDEVFGPNGNKFRVRVENLRKNLKTEEEEGFFQVKEELMRVCVKKTNP